MTQGFKYFVVEKGLPYSVATGALEMIFNQLQRGGHFLLTAPSASKLVLGLGDPELIGRFRAYLESLSGLHFQEVTSPPADAVLTPGVVASVVLVVEMEID